MPVVIVDSSPFFSAAFDALPDALYLFDTNRRLTRLNRAAAKLTNARTGALLGQRCCDMFWRVDGAEECVVDRALANCEMVEVEMMTGDDRDRPTLLRVLPTRDPTANITGTIVIARDMSELRRAEAEALEHKSFMSSLADLAPDEIYALDKEGRITWMNERATAAGDAIATGFGGRYLTEIVGGESREKFDSSLQRTYDGQDTRCEVQVIRSDGTVCHVEAHTSPLWRDGDVTGALVFLRDITERKRAQERMAQSDKLRAVGELAAGVAHNLNNALTVIQGRAQLLMMRSEDEATVKSLEVITRAVGDGSQTLRRILDFARRDKAKDFAPVDLAELISSSVEIARPKWQDRAATRSGNIEVSVENQGAVYVLGEASELREVVLNMIFNSVDALPNGGLIEMGSRPELESACFWVADNGNGMPSDVLARIFEPFYTTKGDRGTGLGLAASHGIIERHGGRIVVVSEPGEGTRFEVRLPLVEKAKEIPQPVARPRMPVVAERAGRILIVEDELRVLALLVEAFEDCGHNVTQAATGSEALKHLEASAEGEKFDVVVSDLGLPEVSGLHLARWVKEHSPGTNFVIVTGWPDMVTPADREQGRIDALIKKPFAVSDVVDQATRLLNANNSEGDEAANRKVMGEMEKTEREAGH